MKFRDFFLINKRVFIFIIIGLLIEEMLVSILISYKFSTPEAQKLPTYDKATLNLWINQIEKNNGYEIVILGDSVVHGDNVESNKTLPIYISKEINKLLPGKKVKVFNMGMAGASPVEIFFLVDALQGVGADLFIYDINLGWFSRKETLEHRSLLELKKNLSEQKLQSLGIEPLKQTDTPIEEWLSSHLFNHWKLFQYRILMNYWLFGKPLRQKLEEAKNNPSMLLPFTEDKTQEILEMRAPWSTKNWAGKLDPTKGRVGDVYLSDNNAQWVLYQMLLDLVNTRKIPMIFFVTPRNYELLDSYEMVNRDTYAKNLSIVINSAEDKGIPVLNYDNAIPNDLFVDTIHPLPKGNQILAVYIVHDLINKGYIKR
ncbi:MAG: hypothetical protein VR69_15915 [Peptococcaceae bacterium BRH_c4b]|nr:MAG: hypothetical protein VR69_15915 [Peptococcaceae bacterium BRH_c4b]